MRNNHISHKKAHFIGIGGIGVSALVRYYLSRGWEVSGSDVNSSPLLRELKKEGVKVKIGHRKRNVSSSTDLVIYTQALPRDNPELKEARRQKIRTLTYPQALGRVTRDFTTIAIAGTHGKSTATALTALTLIEAKMDPTVIVGTKIPQLQGKNFRRGKSKYLVIEADEYKDAFLHYSPTAVLITNIDREHLDYFRDLNHIKRSFLKFISNLRPSNLTRFNLVRLRGGGILVLNKDSAPLFSLRNKIRIKIRIKFKPKIIWYSLREKALARKIKKHLKIPGEHNVSNALGVYKLARALGVREKDIFKAFSRYHGSWRRMEYRGRLAISDLRFAVPVYDDYAHHPTEIKATLAAFREKFPKAKIICVFQPHQRERLKKLFKEFTFAFDEANVLIILDIFKVRGRDPSTSSGQGGKFNSKKLAEAIERRKNGPRDTYLPKSSLLRDSITQNLLEFAIRDLRFASRGAVVVMMGAGDIVELTPRLVSRI
ncbi:MAG: UDP-N-acetylmuramate--L-alanine ligase [Candidatus Colwellbacteria bacterium]|nr:UDP-N-acetylmuramate--L-alanine ligase [Candidatus Colwellbacteria bacterium]